VKSSYRIERGDRFRLADFDPADTGPYVHHDEAEENLEAGRKRLSSLQEKFFVARKQAMLIVLQGMDTSGKDGTIEHVFSGTNPQGVSVTSFKAPSEAERERPYLWRVSLALPALGRIAIFNRSHYEDVLVPRVKRTLPPSVWKKRYRHIVEFERTLAECGVIVLKFFLHIGKDEQKERLLERLRNPGKQWKFNPGDLEERARWGQYMRAYQDAIRRCSAPWAPWYVVPANKKWYRNLVVADAIAQALALADLRPPKPTFDPRRIRID
jgi:PPK2 family polyphosphate:nucleotide phosphotransferase